MNEFHQAFRRPQASAAVLFLAVACSSCVRTVRTSTQIVPDPVPRTAVQAVMKRHIENATDKGDGDFELRALRQRLAANPDDLKLRLLLASAYLERGVPDLALEHYRLANARYPDSVEVALTLAKTLRTMGAPDEALKTIQAAAARHQEGSWELLSFQGILEDERGETSLAEASYRRAVTLEPGRATLHNNLGYNLLLQKKPQEAVVEFRRALELDPRSVTARNNLGEALTESSKPAALAELERAAPSAAVAHNNLGAVLLEQGRYSEARAELDAALQARPDFAEALENLKLVSEHDGQPIALPAPKPSVNLWSHVASGWSRLLGSGHDAKSASAAPNAASPAIVAPAQR